MTTNPTSVHCPNCQAKPGQPCTQPTDTGRKAVTWFHMAREDAAREAEAVSRPVKDDFWHLDGKHRTSAPTANGRDVTRFEFGIREHLESCVKVPRETTNADD